MRNVQRRDVERWLLRHGFEQSSGASGHIQFSGYGIKIALPGHGPNDLTKKHWGMILRQLASVGFDRRRVEGEL